MTYISERNLWIKESKILSKQKGEKSKSRQELIQQYDAMNGFIGGIAKLGPLSAAIGEFADWKRNLKDF